MSAETEWDIIPRLQERCRQLELANATQDLLRHNMRVQIDELLSTVDIMKSMIDTVNDRVTETQEIADPLYNWEDRR